MGFRHKKKQYILVYYGRITEHFCFANTNLKCTSQPLCSSSSSNGDRSNNGCQYKLRGWNIFLFRFIIFCMNEILYLFINLLSCSPFSGVLFVFVPKMSYYPLPTEIAQNNRRCEAKMIRFIKFSINKQKYPKQSSLETTSVKQGELSDWHSVDEVLLGDDH